MQAGFCGGPDVKPVDKRPQLIGTDALPAGELFQHRVRVGDRAAARGDLGADHGLNRFAEHLPVRVEVTSKRGRVDRDLAETFQDVVEREQRVPEGDADVALCRRVGEVALQSRGHERGGERVEQGARELEIRLGVLKADRVDLVRHCRRARRALVRNLPEVPHRDVAPHVGAQVVQYAPDVAHALVQLRLPVMRLDLGGQRAPGQTEPGDEVAGCADPVVVRISGEVRRKGASGAREFAPVLDLIDGGEKKLEAMHEDGELLAHRRWCRGLAVGVREHRRIAQLERERAQRLDEGACAGHPHIAYRRADGEGVGEVVDVFARAREVRELGDRGEPERGELVADEVLDRLDVVARDGFATGQVGDVVVAELGDDGTQSARLVGGEPSRAEHLGISEVDEPLDLDLDARAVEPGFAEVLAERRDLRLVPPVEGAEGLDAERAHETTPCRMPGSSWRKSTMHDRSIMPRTVSNIAVSE